MAPILRCMALALALMACLGAQAQNQVQGVNPADLLTQVQLTGEFNRLDGDTDQWVLTAKYDYRIAGTPFGLNFELPLVIDIDGKGYNASGHGDLFSRVRYIKPLGRWSVGGGFEVVMPLGSDTFSGGRWQTNPSVLAVYAWSPTQISAMVHKRVYGYISDDSEKPDINQYQWRALHVTIYPSGWFRQVDAAYWSDARTGDSWMDLRASLGKQITARARVVGEVKKLTGDQRNDWAFIASYAVKL